MKIFPRTALATSTALFLHAGAATAALEEVVVTATKRAESIQDVPVSVTAVSSDVMQKLNITDVEDLTAIVPNFEINSAAVIPNLYIRGIGGGLAHSIEQTVGRFIDEVYISRAAINLHPFLDVAAVEVLRGPQGTLFGKNTAAGAMIIHTNDPTDDFEAGFNLSYGEYDTTGSVGEVNGFISGGLSDNVSGRLAFIYKDKDGFYENQLNGPDGAEREDYGLQGKLRFDLSDQTTVGLKLSYMEYEEDGSDTAEMNAVSNPPGLDVWRFLGENSGAPNAATFTPDLDWKTWSNCGEALSSPASGSVPIGSFCPGRDQESTNVTLDVEHEVDAGSIKFIMAYQDYDYEHRFHGLESGLANLFRAFRDEQYEGISTELRFTSNTGEKFDYIAGLYYEDSDLDRQQNSDFNVNGIGPNTTFAREHEPWSQTTETFAVFGQARWYFTDRLTGIFGGRWSTETKDFDFERWFTAYGTNSGPRDQDITPISEDRDESRFTPSATIQYDVNENMNIFATAARGHKTGGFSDRIESQDADIEFDEEIVDSFELGMKGSFLDDSLSLNVTLFYMEIEGLQLATQVPGVEVGFSVDNAADSTSQGVELESNWAINNNWTLGLNYAYTDATYDEFDGIEDCSDDYKDANGNCDLAGAPLQYAPENKLSAYVDYFAEQAVAGWDFGARVDLHYTDDQYTDVALQDFSFSESHETISASLRVISPSQKVTLSLIGRNLTNEEINAWTAPSGPNTISAMAPPRLITVALGYKF